LSPDGPGVPENCATKIEKRKPYFLRIQHEHKRIFDKSAVHKKFNEKSLFQKDIFLLEKNYTTLSQKSL